MAEVATAGNIVQPVIDLTHLIGDLGERDTHQRDVDDTRLILTALCKTQNDRRHYNARAMSILASLYRMDIEKFNAVIDTLQPGLDALVQHRTEKEPSFDNVKPIR